MNPLILFTISLLLAHNTFCADADELRKNIDTVIAPNNVMTPDIFFKDHFDAETDQDMICIYSKELSESLYQRALSHDLDAMWQLAEKADATPYIDVTVPLYWLSKITQRIEEIPESADMIKLKERAEQKLNIVAQYARLLNIKTHEEIEMRKRKTQINRAALLMQQLEKKKRKLDTEQTWSMFK